MLEVISPEAPALGKYSIFTILRNNKYGCVNYSASLDRLSRNYQFQSILIVFQQTR